MTPAAYETRVIQILKTYREIVNPTGQIVSKIYKNGWQENGHFS